MQEIWQQAKQRIGAGDLSSALTLLSVHCTGDQEAELITYQSELSRLQQQARLFGKDTDENESELSYRVLQFILRQQDDRPKPSEGQNSGVWQQKRRRSLEKQLEQTYELLSQWEEVCRLAGNPTEAARAKREITRLNELISGYLRELGT